VDKTKVKNWMSMMAVGALWRSSASLSKVSVIREKFIILDIDV
jgi:hypothetical protein